MDATCLLRQSERNNVYICAGQAERHSGMSALVVGIKCGERPSLFTISIHLMLGPLLYISSLSPLRIITKSVGVELIAVTQFFILISI